MFHLGWGGTGVEKLCNFFMQLVLSILEVKAPGSSHREWELAKALGLQATAICEIYRDQRIIAGV